MEEPVLHRIARLRRARDDGFTLIEMLVVVLVVGILTAIAVPVFIGQQDQAHRSQVESDIHHLVLEMESLHVGNEAAYTAPDPAGIALTEGVSIELFVSPDGRSFFLQGSSAKLAEGGLRYYFSSADGLLGWEDRPGFAMPALPALTESYGLTP